MSILRCDDCSDLIDTDADVESYIEKLDKWLCWSCQEDLSEEDLEEQNVK